jgi:RNA polymerase sigma-70 factor (ECF subfamily)
VREPLEPRSDKELIQQALAGDVEAKTEIVRRNEDLVYNLALKLVSRPEDAENVLQETFLKVFEKLDTFKLESSLRTWIYRIAANEALMLLRKRKGEWVSMDDERDDDSAVRRYDRMLKSLDRNPLELLLDSEFKQALERALAELPASRRIPFVLKDIEGLSLQEVAEQLNTSVPAVKSALHRGRTFLRDRLAEFIDRRETPPEAKMTTGAKEKER